MSNHPSITDVQALTGADLKDLASQYDIKGRSKMKAQELRDAICEIIEHDMFEASKKASEELTRKADSYENVGWPEPEIMVPPTFEEHMERSMENEAATEENALDNLSADDLAFVIRRLEQVTAGVRDATDAEVAEAVAELDRPRIVPNRADRRRAEKNRKAAARRVGAQRN